MKKFLKVIACLYAGVVAANALEAKFVGREFPVATKTTSGRTEKVSYIHIEYEKVTEPKVVQYHKMEKGYTIKKVRIDEKELVEYLKANNKGCEELTLEIPGKMPLSNEQVYIGFRAFDELKSDGRLKLKLKFTERDGACVKLPDDCYGMFKNSDAITEIDLSEVDPTPNVTRTMCMFYNCPNLESIKFGKFNTAHVTDMFEMFSSCPKLTRLTLGGNFNTQKVENMTRMFALCDNLQYIVFGKAFDTRNVTNMERMFLDCKKLSNPNLVKNFNTRNVTDMSGMFSGCSGFQTLDLSNFDTKNVANMSSMFSGCSRLLKWGGWKNFDTSNVTNMSGMFSGCKSFDVLDLKGKLNTGKVANMQGMFLGCESLNNVDLSGFDVRNVTNMAFMFCGCKNLVNLDLSNFDTQNVKYMDYMFSECINLKNLNLNNFDTRNLENSGYIFENCGCLEDLAITDKFKLTGLNPGSSEIKGCNVLSRNKLLGIRKLKDY